uniref:Uncharacterized protein LOC104214584 n=1 Tax=Nicotiana sylvestris TaxID=4096 RepID=A0A1U7VC61_NICSY|nr:PREDICTED: uncharacterized protein LOC104214584 [Nicotiana sylvestris]
MTNPQDNPGTPSPPTPSNSSTPPLPSTSPKPRLRRVKMLARKTVMSGALKKKLNEKLKASQVQDSDSKSDSESYKSASEGEGPGSYDSEKTQESPSKIGSSVPEHLETRFVLVGPIKDVELPELRRCGGKKKSEKEKEREGACDKERENRKIVVDDLYVLAICGVEQEKVKESGKKSGGSGSSEAAGGLVHLSTHGDKLGSSTEETLADLLKKVHQDEVQTVEVQTPKPKKCKTSSKKSSFVFEAAEPSLAKRTRSAVKSKQVRISEDKEWNGEEEEEEDESDGE